MAGPFVGRERELGALLDLAQRVAHGQCGAALVIGEPGIGKSRLLDELATACRDLGLNVLFVTGYEPERLVALAAARDLLQRLSLLPAGAPIKRLMGTTTEPARRASATALQLRLFEATHRAQDAGGPALLVVDDAQWLDPSTAALCHYLLRAARPASPLGLVVGGRPAAGTWSLWSSIARLERQHTTRVELGPIDEPAAHLLAAGMATTRSAAEVRDAWERADGSPFWLERLLATGTDARESVREDIAVLDPAARVVLDLLACAGRPVPIDVLDILPPAVRRHGKASIDTLVNAGFVRDHAGALRIAHDLIRATVLELLADGAERAHHLRLGAWLSKSSGDVRTLLEALGHLEAAGGDTAALAVRVASAPERRLVGDEGLARLDAIAGSCSPADSTCRELHHVVARLAVELGIHELALARWSALVEVERGPRAATAALGAARSAIEIGRRDEAWRLLERAEASAVDEATRIEVVATRSAVMRYLDRHPSEARAYADEAVERARALIEGGRPEAEESARDAYVIALVVATDAALMNDDPQRMLVLADELADLTAATHPRTHIDALVQGALARRLVGRNRDAEPRLARALALARAQVMPQAILEVGALLGVVLLTLGRLEEAEAVSRELQALGRRLEEYRPSRVFAMILPHLLALSRGDWRHAVDGLQQAARSEPDPHYRLHGHLERAVALARLAPTRRAAEVREAVAFADADAGVAGCARCQCEVRARGAEALARVGDARPAQVLLDLIDADPGRPAPDWAMAWWIDRARTEMVTSRPKPAASVTAPDGMTQLERLLAAAEEREMVLEAIWCRLDLARLLSVGDRAAAANVARVAGEDASRIGARTEAQVAERILRSLGVRTWRRSRAADAADAVPLTDREREIVDMVRVGRSNPEIAAALFLSRKTVERHLSNVMARLGVRNRTELVAAVDRLESHPPS